ncbi:unnamed protein product [Paramecium pentaurelia]|uniref:Transmembrane protein n=1 Tax=Paramecium pentaurelia TaxID=43138 RepID=A0A8S1VHV0_9CILI|nr:unnamed protein product [Paramecium pentaurelia]
MIVDLIVIFIIHLLLVLCLKTSINYLGRLTSTEHFKIFPKSLCMLLQLRLYYLNQLSKINKDQFIEIQIAIDDSRFQVINAFNIDKTTMSKTYQHLNANAENGIIFLTSIQLFNPIHFVISLSSLTNISEIVDISNPSEKFVNWIISNSNHHIIHQLKFQFINKQIDSDNLLLDSYLIMIIISNLDGPTLILSQLCLVKQILWTNLQSIHIQQLGCLIQQIHSINHFNPRRQEFHKKLIYKLQIDLQFMQNYHKQLKFLIKLVLLLLLLTNPFLYCLQMQQLNALQVRKQKGNLINAIIAILRNLICKVIILIIKYLIFQDIYQQVNLQQQLVICQLNNLQLGCSSQQYFGY